MSVGNPWRRRVHVSAVIFFGLVMAAPFYWMIINSFKSGQEVAAYPPTWFISTRGAAGPATWLRSSL